ncbi:WD40-repeat-containing domain protein [Crucibulum laeve]|uniref:WD40-repeat-containing domain protein n=1 Tax=Crucibulum laeve TaxID=68775 RepID=A0A5C3MBM2_9AGAR|nr:WD40-repeat-containing domain protein [Crucibulum laeve]
MSAPVDLKYNHGSHVRVIRACQVDDATDLLAVGGDHSIDVLLITAMQCRCIASFHVGSRITALAWSSTTVSPSASDDEWSIELAAAGADFGLHLLTKSSSSEEQIFPFGGGLSGHHGKVTDMTFCGGWGEDSARYVATVSDDKMLMVWDLHPSIDITSNIPSPTRSLELDDTPSSSRPQPTAYVIPFPHPLTSICSHPSTSKEFLVSDSHGSVYITDWRSDPEDPARSNLRHSSLMELVEPSTLASATMGRSSQWSGSVAWRADAVDIIGAVYGSKFSVWDVSRLSGGKPLFSGTSFSEGGHRFRWCQTYPEYFAISTQSPTKGAVVNLHNIEYPQAQPTSFSLYPRPHIVEDFDFMAMRGVPRIAAAVGRTVDVFAIGMAQ